MFYRVELIKGKKGTNIAEPLKTRGFYGADEFDNAVIYYNELVNDPGIETKDGETLAACIMQHDYIKINGIFKDSETTLKTKILK